MNKQLKSPRLIILVMILSLMSVLVAGCGDDKYVQSVKMEQCIWLLMHL